METSGADREGKSEEKGAGRTKHVGAWVSLLLLVFLDVLGFGMILPAVTLYGKELGAHGWKLALLGTAYSALQFLCAPVLGKLSDRLGRRPVIVFSLAGSIVASLLFASSRSLWWLILARAAAGACAANIAVAQAAAADLTGPGGRARAMGAVGAAIGLGFVFGPPVGGAIVGHFGFPGPGYFSASVAALNLLGVLLFFPKGRFVHPAAEAAGPHSGEQSQSTARANRREVAALIGVVSACTFLFCIMESSFALLIKHNLGIDGRDAARTTGIVLMAVGVVGVIIQGGLIRKLTRLAGERRLVYTGLASNAAGMLLLPVGHSFVAILLISMFFAVGSSLLNPSLYSLVSKATPPADQGLVFGRLQGASSLGRLLGPFVGLLGFELSMHASYWLAAVSYVGVAAVLFAQRRYVKPEGASVNLVGEGVVSA